MRICQQALVGIIIHLISIADCIAEEANRLLNIRLIVSVRFQEILGAKSIKNSLFEWLRLIYDVLWRDIIFTFCRKSWSKLVLKSLK